MGPTTGVQVGLTDAGIPGSITGAGKEGNALPGPPATPVPGDPASVPTPPAPPPPPAWYPELEPGPPAPPKLP